MAYALVDTCTAPTPPPGTTAYVLLPSNFGIAAPYLSALGARGEKLILLYWKIWSSVLDIASQSVIGRHHTQPTCKAWIKRLCAESTLRFAGGAVSIQSVWIPFNRWLHICMPWVEKWRSFHCFAGLLYWWVNFTHNNLIGFTELLKVFNLFLLFSPLLKWIF